MKCIVLKQLLIVLILCFPATVKAQQTLYAVSGWGTTTASLYKLDPATGAVVATIGNTGLSHVTGMTVDPISGEIYVQSSQLVDSQMVNNQMEYYWQGGLYRLDSVTAAPTFIYYTTQATTFNTLEPPYIFFKPDEQLSTFQLLAGSSREYVGLMWTNSCHLYYKDDFYIADIDTQTLGFTGIALMSGGAQNMFATDINDNVFSGERLSGGFMLKTIAPDFNNFSAPVTDVGSNSILDIAAIAFGRYQPVVSAGNNLEFCAGGSVILTSSIADAYQWKLNGTDIPGADQQSYEATQSGNYTVEVTMGCGKHLSEATTVTVHPIPALSTSVTNVSCFGMNNGAIDLSAGTGNYTYSWNNGATTEDINNLSPGNYSVTVVNMFGCSASTSATISEPANALTATSGGQTDPTSGNNGSAIVVVNGGTPPYTYNWSPSGGNNDTATGLGSGSYTVIVTDANGCTASQAYTLTQTCNVSFTGTITNVICNGQSNGAIDVTITSGTGTYTYNWGGGVTTQDRTGLAAGTYTLTVSNALGCTATQTFTVTQPAPLIVTGTVTGISCYGAHDGAIDVSVTGGTPGCTYKWADVNQNTLILWLLWYYNQWNNNSNNTWPGYNINTQDRTAMYPGFYWVQATDGNGCKATANFAVDQPSPLYASISKANVSCNGGSNGSINLSVSGGTPLYAYQWSNGATTQDLSGVSAGTYSVTITDAHSCTQTASTTITQPSALNANINVNPMHTVSGQAPYTIFLGYGPQSVTLQGSASGGSTPYSYDWAHTISSNQNQSVSPTSTTTYTLTVTDNKGCTATATRTEYVKNADAPGNNKVYICHNGNTMSVASSAVPGHLNHGDYLGQCMNTTARTTDDHNEDDGHGHELSEFEGGDIKVYPNPNNGIFTVEVPMQGTADVVITDIAGKVIHTQHFADNTDPKLQFNLGNNAQGIYFIRLKIGDGIFQSKVTLQ